MPKATLPSSLLAMKPGDEWACIEAVLAHADRVILYGPPGTGKTRIANDYGTPERVYNIYLTEETPAAELRGHYVPKGGEWIWQDGPAILAWRQGARLVVNEVNNASGDALDFLLAILDDPEHAGIDLPTGERVKPAAGFQVIATMNGEPDDLPAALEDRFVISFHVQRPNPDALRALPPDVRRLAIAEIEENPRAQSVRGWNAFRALRERVPEAVAAFAVWGIEGQAKLDALTLARDGKTN